MAGGRTGVTGVHGIIRGGKTTRGVCRDRSAGVMRRGKTTRGVCRGDARNREG